MYLCNPMKKAIVEYFKNKGFSEYELEDESHFMMNNTSVNGRYHIDIQGNYDESGEYYIVDVRLIGIKHIEYKECFEYGADENVEVIINDAKNIIKEWVGKF